MCDEGSVSETSAAAWKEGVQDEEEEAWWLWLCCIAVERSVGGGRPPFLKLQQTLLDNLVIRPAADRARIGMHAPFDKLGIDEMRRIDCDKANKDVPATAC